MSGSPVLPEQTPRLRQFRTNKKSQNSVRPNDAGCVSSVNLTEVGNNGVKQTVPSPEQQGCMSVQLCQQTSSDRKSSFIRLNNVTRLNPTTLTTPSHRRRQLGEVYYSALRSPRGKSKIHPCLSGFSKWPGPTSTVYGNNFRRL